MAHILVIDDDPLFCEMQALMLQQDGHQVATADNGIDAMKLLQRIQPDLIITDILMPEMDGVEIILALSRRGSKTPIIAMSGGRSSITPKFNLAALLGVKAMLAKPFSRTDLRKAIEEALA